MSWCSPCRSGLSAEGGLPRAVCAEARPEWAELSHLVCKRESPGKCLVKTQSLPPGHRLPTPSNSSSTAALAPQTEAVGGE